MVEVIMPKMGDGMEEGTLLEWLKKDGEKVKSGEVIGTIQTDKATLELEAPGSGTLRGILLAAGETIPVGRPIALLLKDGESVPANWGSGAAVALQTESGSVNSGADSGDVSSALQQAPEITSQATPESTRLLASPLAKKTASELGVDLRALTGSGPSGRIVQKDVLTASSSSKSVQPAQAASITSQPVVHTPSGADLSISLSKIRQITAKRTTESKQQVPHFYVTVEVDVEKILALREMFEEEESGKVSINDFVVKASAFALRDMPQVNSLFGGTTLTQLAGIHVGIAVALADGLTVPVVKSADQFSLRQISARVKDLARRAKDNKLSMDELTGSTFSISNMGMLDVDNFFAIINQPNSAILAISSVRKRVVVGDEDEIEIRNRMNITCSFDHRVLDGAVGANFINLVKQYLENPSRLLG